MKFESLKMHDDEYISKYFLRVDEVVNTIRGLDEELEEPLVLQKVFISQKVLQKRFNAKVLDIEEMTYLKTLTLDQLLATLATYEMRISNGRSTTKESSFKIDKNPKEEQNDSCYESNEEEVKSRGNSREV